jgi:hypothetical protein
VGESGGSKVFLRGGGRNAPVEGGKTTGAGICAGFEGFVDLFMGAGGDGCFDLDGGRLESSEGLGGGSESVLRGGKPGRLSSMIEFGPDRLENPN